MQNFHPLGSNVLILCDKPESEKGGLFIPEKSQDKKKPTEGVVIKAAPGVTEVRSGDRVIFPAYCSQDSLDIRIGNDTYRMTPFDEIIAVREKEAA